MPGGDGTGPMGFGPMTGRAAGYCAGFPVPGFMNPWVGGGWGRGRGRGLGRGWGRGFGRGLAWRRGWGGVGFGPAWGPMPQAYGFPAMGPQPSTIPPDQEAGMLREQEKHLTEWLEQIRQRIGELGKA